MLKQYNRIKTVFSLNSLIFIIRNIILFYLVINAYNQFKNDLNLIFICTAFAAAVLMSFIIYRTNLKNIFSIILLIIIPFLIRIVIFLFINIIIRFHDIPENNLLFLHFDNNFYPMLVPWIIISVFNLSALRFNKFIRLEIILNVVFLITIFITEINYNIKLMHPTVFAVSISFFILTEISLLYLLNKKELKSKHTDYRQLLICVPVLTIVLILIFLFVSSEYNKGITKKSGGLISPTLFRFDFTSYLTLQSEIEQSDDLVMLYRKNGHAEKMLLRRFVLSDYREKEGFILTSDKNIENIPFSVPGVSTEFEDPGYKKRKAINQEYFIVNFDPNSLLGLNYPVKSVPIKNWDSSSFIRIFSVDSKISTALGKDLKNVISSDIKDHLYDFYTDYGNDSKIMELAVQITENRTNYYDKVTAIRDYLKNNYYYSLKPGIAEDGNLLYHFLFRNNHLTGNVSDNSNMKGKGYCSYFAYAMTLMARSLGIPARVAVGFLVYPDSSVLNFYEIREYQAHAWVEVYFNEYGWIEFDPTSGTVAPGEEYQIPSGPDMEELTGLIEEILNNELIEDKSGQLNKNINNGSDAVIFILNSLKYFTEYWYLILPAIYLILIFLIKYHNLLLYKISGSSYRKIKHLFFHSERMLKNCNIKRNRQESLVEFSIRIKKARSINLKDFTDIYLKSVFAESISENDLQKALELYKKFKFDYKKNIPAIYRIAGFFNPLGVFI